MADKVDNGVNVQALLEDEGSAFAGPGGRGIRMARVVQMGQWHA